MSSRAHHKQQLRAERIEQAHRRERRRRLRMIAASVIVVLMVVASVIAIGSAGGNSAPAANPGSKAAQEAAARVEKLLAGLPQSRGNVLGDPTAPATVTVFSDLECSACDAFDLAAGATSPSGITGTGILDALIRDEVATGKAKLVFRSLETATASGASPQMWTTQQAAVNAAGLQGKAWNYVKLFYSEQGAEGAPYVTMGYLEGLAKQIPGLDYARWQHSLTSDQTLRAQVARDNTAGTQLDSGRASTPTIWVNGPRNEAVFQGITRASAQEVSTLEAAIRAAS